MAVVLNAFDVKMSEYKNLSKQYRNIGQVIP